MRFNLFAPSKALIIRDLGENIIDTVLQRNKICGLNLGNTNLWWQGSITTEINTLLRLIKNEQY